MKSELTDKIKSFIERLKKIKHIHIYLAIGLALIVGVIYFAFSGSGGGQKSESTDIDKTYQSFSSSSEYSQYLENKLENVITSVKGAGETKVLVTLEKGFEYVYLTEEETKTSSNGTTVTTLSIVMVDGQPVVKEEIYPVVKGILVIAEGAEDVNVRMNILSLIQTVIEVNNSQINILAAN